MATTLGDINVEIGAKLTKLQKGVDQANKELSKLKKGQREVGSESDKLSKQFGALGKAIAGAFAVREIVKFGQEAVRLAGQMQGVEAGFERLGGTPALMNRLTQATRGTVSELELMQSAVQAGNFGIELEALPQLMEFASRRAQETGQSVDYLVDSIVTGIGRKSPLILDNLGISAVALKEELGGASLEASNIGDVSQAVGAIATRELEKMGETTVTTTDRIAQANSAFENMQVAIGQRLSGAVETVSGDFAGLFNAVADLFALNPSDEYRNQSIELKTLSRQILDTTTDEDKRKSLIEEVQKLYPDYLQNIDAEKASYEELESALKAANEELENKTILAGISEEYQDAADDVSNFTRRVAEYEAEAQRLATVLEQESGLHLRNGESLSDYVKRVEEADVVNTGLFSTASKLRATLDRQSGATMGLEQAQASLNEESQILERTRERLNLSAEAEAEVLGTASEANDDLSSSQGEAAQSTSNLTSELSNLQKAFANIEADKLISELTGENFDDVQASVNALSNEIQRLAGEGYALHSEAVQDVVKQLQEYQAILNDRADIEAINERIAAFQQMELPDLELAPEMEDEVLLALSERINTVSESMGQASEQTQGLADTLSRMFGITNKEALVAAKNIGMTAQQFQLASNAAYGLAASMQAALIDTMAEGKDFGKAMIDFLKNLVLRLIAAAAAAAALAAILTIISGGATTFGSAFTGGFGKLSGLGGMLSLDGARADGGPVMGGGSYLVGEEGPEIFTPSTSGMILPNSALSSVSTPSMMVSSPNNMSQSITVRVEGEITGDNIRLVGENATQRNDRRQRG